MEYFNQKKETQRFIKAFNFLKEEKKFRNINDFCKSIGYRYTSLKQVLDGVRDIPFSYIVNTSKVYGINLEFFLSDIEISIESINVTGSNNLTNNGNGNNFNIKMESKEREIELLKEQIKAKDKLINILEDQLAEYKTKKK